MAVSFRCLSCPVLVVWLSRFGVSLSRSVLVWLSRFGVSLVLFSLSGCFVSMSLSLSFRSRWLSRFRVSFRSRWRFVSMSVSFRTRCLPLFRFGISLVPFSLCVSLFSFSVCLVPFVGLTFPCFFFVSASVSLPCLSFCSFPAPYRYFCFVLLSPCFTVASVLILCFTISFCWFRLTYCFA